MKGTVPSGIRRSNAAAEPTRRSPLARALRQVRTVATSPAGFLAASAGITLVMGWQFIADASRAVPALDTAWYQWRAEFLQASDPGALIAIQGAEGALAGGYRIAEPVLAAVMRIMGDVGPETPTVVLSVMFRVLATVGMAAFAWKHRRSALLLYLTLAVIPSLFLLQRFFGFLDNFFALALMAGVLLLLDELRQSWLARVAVTLCLFLAGLSHPTTLALFLVSMGAVAGYRLLRERSIRAVLRSDIAPVLWAGLAAVVLTAAFWLGGLWGPTSSFGEAAVPPPQPLQYFVDRSVNVLKGMQPFVLIPVTLIGLGAIAVSFAKTGERFSEITLAWTLPLIGMFGFVLGAAYPYFRFFNATLAPPLATAVGFATIMALARRFRSPLLSRAAPVVAAALVAGILFGWWSMGLSRWNKPGGTWLTPEVRETMAAANAYMGAEPERRRAVFVVDAQPGSIVPYGKYKDFANAIYAGVEGDRIDDSLLFFGRVEDFEARRASSVGNGQYDGLAADTAAESLAAIRAAPDDVVVFMPMVFNEHSTNDRYLDTCADCPQLSESGLYVLPELMGPRVGEPAAAAARRAAAEARAFEADPPGALDNFGGTLLAILGLGLLFGLPGWLLVGALPERSSIEALALIPVLSIAAVTTTGVVLLAILRGPLTPAVGWTAWGIAVAAGLALRALSAARRVSTRD